MVSLPVRAVLVASMLVGCTDAEVATGTDRLSLVGQPVQVVADPSTRAPSIEALAAATTRFTYVASVDAPVLAGQKVQATNFTIHGHYAYVVYNTAGEEIAGGLDVIDVTHVDAPVLVGSYVDASAEFSDVAAKGQYAFAVGSDGVGGLLAVWDVRTPTRPTTVARLGVGSQYATSITIDDNNAYITVGAAGGLVVVDISAPTTPRVVRGTLAANALYLSRTNGINLVLGGASTLELSGERNGTIWPMLSIAPTHVEAPGRFATSGHQLFTNAGYTGLTTIDVASNTTSATMGVHQALPGVGNGIDASAHALFLAQGDAGALVYTLDAGAPTYLGQFAFPDVRGSANQIRYARSDGNNSFLFLSGGLGGFRILSFQE